MYTKMSIRSIIKLSFVGYLLNFVQVVHTYVIDMSTSTEGFKRWLSISVQ